MSLLERGNTRLAPLDTVEPALWQVVSPLEYVGKQFSESKPAPSVAASMPCTEYYSRETVEYLLSEVEILKAKDSQTWKEKYHRCFSSLKKSRETEFTARANLAAVRLMLKKYRSAPKEWVTKDMSVLIMHLKEDTNFDANLVESMLKFAIECAALSNLPEIAKENS